MTLCSECYKRGYREGKARKGDWDDYRPPFGADRKRCSRTRDDSIDHFAAYQQGFWDGAVYREPRYS